MLLGYCVISWLWRHEFEMLCDVGFFNRVVRFEIKVSDN
jgi:hypothetical protein